MATAGRSRLLYADGPRRHGPVRLASSIRATTPPRSRCSPLAAWSIMLVPALRWRAVRSLAVVTIASGSSTSTSGQAPRPSTWLTDYAMFGAVSFETLAVSTCSHFVRFPRDQVRLPYRCRCSLAAGVYVLTMACVLANMFMTNRAESIVAWLYPAVARSSMPPCCRRAALPKRQRTGATAAVEIDFPPTYSHSRRV